VNLWKKYQAIPSLILLVTIGLITGCSPTTTIEISNNPSSGVTKTEVNPSSDWANSTEGQIYAEALNNSAPSGQIQAPQTSADASDDFAPEITDSPDMTESPDPAGALLESPALKSAPATESQPDTETIPQTAQESLSESGAVPAGEPNIGFQAPDFSLQTLDGQLINLADLRGKNVLLNYWVTWCIPCIEEMPALEKLNQEYQDQNLVILSVNGIKQDELETVKATIGEFSLSFPVTLDQSGTVYDSYEVQFMPTSFFIDDLGVIRYIQLGSSSEEGLRSKIEQLISDQL
jgi:cytochrome c biogenesis protein CcmG, thiol:disulfide interchange protein DsbE